MMRKLFHVLPARVQDNLKAWHDKHRIDGRHLLAMEHLEHMATEISAHCLEDIRTLADWHTQRPVLRQQVAWMLGLDPLPVRTTLAADVTGVLERANYRIEKLVYQSLPGLYVTANLYLPKGTTGPVPCIMYLCGHMPHPVGAKTQYQDRYLWYPMHGFACMVIDPLEFGEVPGLHRGTHNLNLWHWLSLGYTPAGVEVWNAMRALDYLEARPEINGHRIGVTGISGGGVMTWFLGGLDDRVAACVPSCSAYTIGSQVSRRLLRKQCDCTYYPNTFLLDFPVIAALIAPRPLLITSGRRDPIFPPAGYHEVFRRAKRIYDLYDPGGRGSQRIREVEANVAHTDPPLFLREARQWMQRWLREDSAPLPRGDLDGDMRFEASEALACLNRLPADALNFSIHDRLVALPSACRPTSLASWRARRAEVQRELAERVFRWFPTNPIPFATRTQSNRGAYIPRFADFAERLFETEPGAPVRVQVFRPRTLLSNPPLLIVAKQAGDCGYFPDIDELLPLLSSTAVIVLYPRFSERVLGAAEFSDIERAASMTGRTVAALQIWDVRRTVRWALEEERLAPASVSVYGRGQAGIVCLYAALFEDTVSHVVLRDPPASHWQRPALLSVLRITDIPEVAGALAPRRLTVLGELPETFGLTRELYRVASAEPLFRLAPSLADALLEGLAMKGQAVRQRI
jgi:cephalosporin-C deacetylase-like acetyl esterase